MRTPDAPVGFLAQDSGIAQIYAGSSKIVLGINSSIHLTSNDININCSNWSFNVPSLSSIKFKDKQLNDSLFDNSKMIQALSLDGEVITPDTKIVDGKIINTKKLSDYLYETSLLEQVEMDKNLFREADIMAEYLNFKLPEWL